MKNKSARHKDINTFKFQPFSERIANIDVDVFHKVDHEYQTETDDESYFYQAIQKWNVLNLTEGYELFCKEVHANNYITLPQLLLSKDHVINTLTKYLKLKNPLCLQPLLEIVVAVAKDLRKEFYIYYPEILEILIDLLNTKDAEQLEWTFTCLAYLFKFLWRSLIKDINAVFNALLPLLSDSKPEYINKFAAESFAFVARKVKDKHTFLSFLLKAVKSNPDSVEGCGKLIFEVINGVDGQFHSCSEVFLTFLFSSLSNDKLPQNILFEILEQIISNVVVNIHPQNSTILWNILMSILEELLTKWKYSQDNTTCTNLELMLKLLGEFIEHKNAKFVQNPVPVVQFLVKLLSEANVPHGVTMIVCKIVIVMLLSKNVKLPQENASQVIRKILTLEDKSVFLYFIDNINDYASFEPLILPGFLRHCVSDKLNTESLHVLTKLVLKKSPLCESGINLSNWKCYPINFQDPNSKVENLFTDFLNIDNAELNNYFGDYFCALICIPHIKLLNLTNIKNKIESNSLNIIEKLKTLSTIDNSTEIKKMLFILKVSFECLIHISDCTFIRNCYEGITECLLKFANNSQFILSLKMFSMILTALKDDNDIITMKNLVQYNNFLEKNFSSPFHEVRLYTAHIYTLFEHLQEFKLKHSEGTDVASEEWKIFSICYNVESIDPNVQTYRDQLQKLEKLTFDKPQMIMCNQTNFRTIPLRYLCGALYMNFQLLWEPIIKIIETHAHGLDINTFWDVYVNELIIVTKHIRELKDNKIDVMDCKYDFVSDLYQQTQTLDVKPDFYNYRVLLWKAMCLFADIAETKTRDISDIFLDFINTEYKKTNSDMALVCNIRENDGDRDNRINVEEEVNEDIEITEKILPCVPKTNNRINLKSLLNMLGVFSKIRSPLSMYREPELYKLYFDLLQNKNADVQKSALDCIMVYKHKFLTPYKENLYNLINDKNFKNEIVAFRVDKESDIILPDHRQNLIPIVMQIVFSKMNAKTGLRTGGKSSGQNRRNLVLRFLAGCQENEIFGFVEKSFRLYQKFIVDDPEEMVNAICQNTDLNNFLPPKRLQSSLNLLTVILEQFGGHMGNDILTFLLRILLVIGAAVKGALDDVENVHVGYLPILRNLKTSGIKIIERFFEHFDRYPWTVKQIDAVFTVFVWPNLDKLNVEGIHSPTALLKLFVQWGSNPRYFSLLAKYKEGNLKQYILPHIFKLLINEKSHGTVVNCIEDLIQNLLSLQADEEDIQMIIPINQLLPVEQKILERIKLNDKINYGSCILLPHVSVILEKIRRKLQTKSKNLNQKEIFILSRVSELVWQSDICDQILQLLIPVVIRKCSIGLGEEIILQYLNSLNNLLQNVDNQDKHLRQLLPLFSEVSFSSGRKLLIRILENMSNRLECNAFKEMYELISALNAWDQKWLDQPDFERRHNAFKTIQNTINETNISVDLGVLLIYNLYYLIKSEKDLSIRENSSYALKYICPLLINKYQNSHKDIDFILNTTILTLIRTGMKSKKDEFRSECILLLGHLARECPESHPVLQDLSTLTNKIDLEVDFFANLTHLQLHRHARALLKFCQVAKNQTNGFNTRTLTQFILPLASFYLCSEKYSNKNSVIDAAIETIGTVCRILPWHQYEGILKFYLNKLRWKIEYQRQLVRLSVAILDAFHFDLNKGQVTEIHENINGEVNKSKDVKKDEDVSEENTNEDVSEENTNEEVSEENTNEECDIPALDEDEVSEGENETQNETKAYEKVTVLCKSTATRVINIFQSVLLPQLHKSLAEMTHHESSHKINRKKTGTEREEEDLLRVPISLALVKLLQRLPTDILEANLPGIFMKTCTFLKSPLDSVRRVARETLQKIMLSLGPRYLRLLLAQIAPLLQRGFQVHVLVFTTHAILICLKEQYQPGDIDNILLTVLDLCKADLFGAQAEEKEVAKIVIKVSEAKSTKSFDTFQILAQFITEKCLMDLLMPIKQILETSRSYKNILKTQECLRHIAHGLVENAFLPTESLLKFAYGTSSESIPQLAPIKKKKLNEKERQKLLRQKPDCFIIPKNPGNRTAYRQINVKSAADTNFHQLTEFGIRLCLVLLKKEKLKDDDFKTYLDPFVVIFQKCLNSKHVKLSTLTLQCLSWVLKYDLPSLKDNIKTIAKDMFNILHKYASAGLSKGDNFDLVVAAFKAMTVLVRDVKYYTVQITELKILLLYAEQDMHDHDRQATAFGLLKAIIARKLIVPEIHDVMKKVAELSITSELDYVRLQARIVFHQFLMDYPLGNLLESHLAFYLSQMNYAMQYGRESAIEMIQTLINSFPTKILANHSGMLMVSLGARLVNDEVPECRKLVANCISSMLNKIQKSDRDSLFEIVILWMKDKNVSHRRLASQLCGIFVTVEKSSFDSRLRELMPLILRQFGIDNVPGRFVKIQKEKQNKYNEQYQRVQDHHLFQVYQLLLKISAHCPSFLKDKDSISNIAVHTQSHLAHPHDWIRLAASQFLGFILSAINVDDLSKLLVANEKDENGGYLFLDPVNSIKSLTLDLCDQLHPDVKNNLAEQVIKNLVFVARVLQNVTVSDKNISLLWLAKRMRKIVNTEIVENASNTVLRMEVFKWIAGVGTALEVDKILPILPHLLAPLVREMITTEEKNAPLRQFAKEVANLLKKRVGLEEYTTTLSKLQQNLSVKRAERKRSRTQLAVTDPELFAKKKIKRHEKKKEVKKRKISERKDRKQIFKRPKLNLEDSEL